MKFVRRDLGGAAEASSGGGERGFWREVTIVLGVVGGLVLVAYFTVGWVVEAVLPRISIETEQAWFARLPIDGMIEASASGGDDGATAAGRARAEAVLAKLSRGAGEPAVALRLVVSAASEPNAFAYPGGTIVVTQGLLDLVGDDEVAQAFVLGHEIGHFAQRDHLRRIGRGIGQSLVFWLLFGGSGDVLSQRAYDLLERGHSRQQERGADAWGLRLVLETYGTAQGSERLFAWLAQRSGDPGWLQMLATHPAPEDRIGELRALAGTLAVEGEGER